MEDKSDLNKKIDKLLVENKKLFSPDVLTIIIGVTVSLGYFCIGSFVGWSSHVIKNYRLQEEYVVFTHRELSIILSSLALTAIVSPIIAQKIYLWVGTKILLLLSSFYMITAWMMISFSSNYWMYLCSRLCAGLAVGILHFIIPVYLYEIATVKLKPILDCILCTQFALGILFQYFAGTFFSTSTVNMISSVPPFLLFIGCMFVPESPFYLCLKRKQSNAKKILKRFQEKTIEIENQLNKWDSEKEIFRFKEIFSLKNLRNFLPVFGLLILEQLIGITSFWFFLHRLLLLTKGSLDPNLTKIILAFIFVSSLTIYKLGGYKFKDRTMLLWTLMGMILSASVLGSYCIIQGMNNFSNDYGFIPLSAYGCIIFCYTIGIYRITWKLIDQTTNEFNHFTVRAFTTSLTWSIIYILTRFMPRLIDVIGVGWMFLNMAVACLFTFMYVVYFVFDINEPMSENKLESEVENLSDDTGEVTITV